ncbi:MAG: SBBP repeat-containing protein [Promethearchaeota archaeon]
MYKKQFYLLFLNLSSKKIEVGIIIRIKYFLPRIIFIIIISGLGTSFIVMPFFIIYSCPPVPPIDWTKIWGGTHQEIMYDMVVDSSKDIFIAGEIWNDNNSSNDIFILKINESLNYNETWGDQLLEEFCGMVLDAKDNIFVAGTSESYLPSAKEVFLLKYSNNLTLNWFINWSGTGIDSCTSIAVDSQDNIYITGTMNYPNNDVFLVKYNNSGIIQWNRTWTTGFLNISEEALSLVIDSKDQLFLSVKTNFTGSEWFLLKYDFFGNLLLNASYNKYLPLEQLVLDSADNLYAVGTVNDAYLTKFDNNGNLQWNLTCIQEILLGTESIKIDRSDNIYITGNELIDASAILDGYNMIDYDTYLMKFNNAGVLQWNKTISYANNLYLEILAFDPLGNIYLGGSLEMIAPGSLSYTIRIYDHLGNRKRSEGGGCNYGDGVCKGIYAESPNGFIAAINSPCYNKENYDIELTKYIEPDYGHCPPLPNPWLMLILPIALNSVFIIIGISYLIIKDKKRR